MKPNVGSRFLRLTHPAKAGALLCLLGAASLVNGCAKDPKPAHLDVATAPGEISDDEWLRQRQLMHILTLDPAGDATGADVSPDVAISYLYTICDDIKYNAPPISDSCAYNYAIEVRWAMCMAHSALAVATTQSDPLTLKNQAGYSYIFDHVTEANAADMAAIASEYARSAISYTTSWLINPPAACKSAGSWVNAPNLFPLHPWPIEFASAATEAYYLGLGALDRATEAILNTADQARSSSASSVNSRNRAILATKYSRAAAAHLLVGGEDGLLGSTTQGYCLSQSLSPSAKAALQLLRDAAPPPVLLNDPDINVLLNSNYTNSLFPTCTDCGGSVRQRLGKFYSLVAMQGAAGESVEQHYDIPTADFVKARDYLRQEVSVFNRSAVAKRPPEPDASGYSRFAGTAADRVQALPAGAWAARARYTSVASPWTSAAGRVYIDPHLDDPGYYIGLPNFRFAPFETFIAGSQIAFRDVLKSTDNFSTSGSPPIPSSIEVKGLLGSVLTSRDYLGTMELWTNGSSLRTAAFGFKSTDKIRLMVGEDGLRCAVTGNVEGAPCNDPMGAMTGEQYNFPATGACVANPASFSCMTLRVLAGDSVQSGPSTYGTDFLTGLNTTRTVTTSDLLTKKTRLFYVRLKSGAIEAPGNYELLVGTPLISNDWVILPVVPSMSERTAKVLAPNRRNCALPNVSCMGQEYDSRLPLEDELASDGDQVENSWKHYLDLARQAANESDMLGRDFRDAKLNKLQGAALAAQRAEERRQAAEGALMEVQSMCGTALDNRALLEYLSGSDGSTNLDNVAVAACNAGNCPAGQMCVAGMCLRDPAGLNVAGSPLQYDPDAKKLADCLSTSAMEKFVTLGDTKLCIYSTAGNPNDVCPTALTSGGTACPTVKPSAGCPTITGYDLNEARALGYFSNPKPSNTVNACLALRQARKAPSSVEMGANNLPTPYGVVKNGEVFLRGRLSDTTGRLGFVAKMGGYFDITEDGAVRWSSGNLANARTPTGWPSVALPECASDQTGLFCSAWPAPSDPLIGSLNTRAFAAVWAAAGIRTWDNPNKVGLDITFPSPGGWPSTEPSTTTIYKDHVTPVWETKAKLSSPGDRGFKTSYTWLQSGSTTLWIPPNGVAINTATQAGNPPALFAFFGPSDPWKPQHAQFEPVMNWPTGNSWGYRDEMLQALSGAISEDYIAPVKLNARQAGLLNYLFTSNSANTESGIANVRLPGGAVLDGYELLCELDRIHNNANTKLTGPPSDFGDREQAAGYLRALAAQIEASASMVTFPQIPTLIADQLDQNAPRGGATGIGGEMGDAVSTLKTNFIQFKETMPIMASQLQQMSAASDILSAQLDAVAATKDLNQNEYDSTIFKAVNDCAASTFTAVITLGAGAIAMASSCANMAWEFHSAGQKLTLKNRIAGDDGKIDRGQYTEKMSQLALAMQEAAIRLETNLEQVNGALIRIDSLRKKANLALSKAMYLASYQSAQQVSYDKSVGALSDIAQRRYIASLTNAKVMSFFARRAIEQRLGIDLSQMHDDLPLVAAPASWEGTACTMSGIQADPGTSTDTNATADGSWVATYGEGFIGDYVDKLERTVESYRLTENFHEGQDVAVISLRDDVFDSRSKCKLPSRNLFKNSADLTNAENWGARNCSSVTVNGVAQPGFNCIQALACDGSCDNFLATVPGGTSKAPDMAVLGQRGAQQGAQGHILRFGDGKTCSAVTTPPVASPCSWTKANVAGEWPPVASALSQIVTLRPGKYRLSWFTKDAANTGAARSDIVVVRPATNALGYTTPNIAAPTNYLAPQVVSATGAGWKRASIEFTTVAAGDYEVGFAANVTTRPTDSTVFTLGGPMLEAIPSDTTATFWPPFQATDADDLTSYDDCEDKGGIQFRRDNWSRECTHLCNEGFAGNCTDGPLYCYQEFTFDVAQPWVASGKLFKYSGFARGNFNYRIDSLALNFVGSNTRDCTDSTLPSTCYNAGFIPYSIQHNGPFFIRNHDGNDVEAMLFDGRIEHARGLALERYITNPISSTDRDLLSDYYRHEFSGRPLDGTFTVRLWEEPGVNLEGIEDVQLLLNYRYWTANE